MKNLFRAFVFSLVVTGAIASTQVNNNAGATVMPSKVSLCPVPVCPPDDPNACGFGTVN